MNLYPRDDGDPVRFFLTCLSWFAVKRAAKNPRISSLIVFLDYLRVFAVSVTENNHRVDPRGRLDGDIPVIGDPIIWYISGNF